MARPSSIDRLPAEVREKIGQLRGRGRTIDEIMEVLDTLLPDEEVPSRSAVGRHLQRREKVMQRMRESRQMAEALAKNFGDKSASDLTRANLEILNDLILRIQIGGDGDKDVVFQPQDLMFLATALQKTAAAGKTDFEAQLKVELEKERRAVKKEAVDKVASIGRQQGLSAETIKAFKAGVLGVDT